MKAKCQHSDCGYEWETRVEKIFATCPSCMRKTKIKEEVIQ